VGDGMREGEVLLGLISCRKVGWFLARKGGLVPSRRRGHGSGKCVIGMCGEGFDVDEEGV